MKVSIRFFNDREVRTVWDEQNSKWWFSVLDIIGILRDESDYQKNRTYWKCLKAKLKKENKNLVSDTNQMKLLVPDGKLHLIDALENKGNQLGSGTTQFQELGVSAFARGLLTTSNINLSYRELVDGKYSKLKAILG